VHIFGQTGHQFRFKLDSNSGSKWTGIPEQTGQIGAKRRARNLTYGIISVDSKLDSAFRIESPFKNIS
jgi:hypothetical protein